ncbi:MAG: LptF/LptG family permease [Candidatus Aminicenantes bacterium]|nr:LptF/LptG family permease [Candidatus Aminicenantes bacterium]
MFKSFDRYLLKEIASPFTMGLLVYTFTLLINTIFLLSRTLIEKEASTLTIIKILVYLLPDFLSFTIPMATLMGVLAGLSRMSTDSEIVAFRTMGVNNSRIFRPVLVFSIITWLFSSWLIMYMAPEANYRLSKLMVRINLKRTVSNIKPGDFYKRFNSYTLYFKDVDSRTNEWLDVFLYSKKKGDSDSIILAKRGKFVQGKNIKEGYISLRDVTVHSYKKKDPEESYGVDFYSYLKEDIRDFIKFKQTRRSKQLIFPKLLEKMEEEPGKIDLQIEFHRKFSLPITCIALGLLALSLGISTKKGGKISGFTISLGIIFTYYTGTIVMENMVRDRIVSPFWGMWGAVILLFIVGIILYYYTAREKTIDWKKIYDFLNRVKSKLIRFYLRDRKILFIVKVKRWGFRFIKLIDLYVVKKIVFSFFLIFSSLLLVFYIIDVVELIDDVFQNDVAFSILFKYIYYNTPEILSFIIPVSILTAVLLTFSLMSKNNEIAAVKVSGISLYRLSLPAVVIGLLLSLAFLLIQENVTPGANKKAREILNTIHKREVRTERKNTKNWVLGNNRDIYFYNFMEHSTKRIHNFNIVYMDEQFNINKRISARFARWSGEKELILEKGFEREFENNHPKSFESFTRRKMHIEEGRDIFTQRVAFSQYMNIKELREYINYLKKSKSETARYEAKLYYKYAFPFSSLIMVIIAIPFSFLMGSRGALFGIGMAVGISMVFWFFFAIFSALGAASILTPFISAFAPLFIFTAFSIYLFINIKT